MLTAYHPMPRQLPIAREGFPFLGIACAAALLLWLCGLEIGCFLMLAAAGSIAAFFRNPTRQIPQGPGLVVSPADGRVLSVAERVCAPYTGRESTRVSIFMSVLSVHINRFPVAAVVKRVVYSAGRFLVASLDKASASNERNGLVFEDDAGREFVLVQIAGLVARRIVCYVREGDALGRGDRIGLIRFGSRVDLYLPPEAAIVVKPGDRVRGGSSLLGRFACD
jgi:phosphatidylserine decarboxylase